MGIFSGSEDFFGLDLDDSVIKVVQLKGGPQTKTIFRYGQVSLDDNLTLDGDGGKLPQIAEVLREVLAQNQITTRNVVLGLPATDIYSMIQKFEREDALDFKRTLRFQGEKLIPSGYKDSKVDWAVLDVDIQEAPEKEVFICSADKNFIERRLELLESANLNVLAFEPNALALIRAVTGHETNHGAIIVNLGLQRSEIVVVYRNQPRLITACAVGVAHIVRSVMNSLRLEHHQAHQILFSAGLDSTQDPAGELANCITQALDDLISKIKQSVNHLAVHYPESNLQQIILFGDGAYIPYLNHYLQSILNIPAALGNAWQNVNYHPDQQNDLNQVALSFGFATGLAERQDL